MKSTDGYFIIVNWGIPDQEHFVVLADTFDELLAIVGLPMMTVEEERA